MTVITGLAGMVAVVLVAGGLAKSRAPGPTVESFRVLRMPATTLVVRLLAVAELAVGMILLVLGGRPAAIVGGVLFGAFTLVSVALVRRGDAAASCGCFGARSARPSLIHVAVDAVATAVLAWAAVAGVTGWVDLASDAAPAIALVGLQLVGGYLLVSLMTVLPGVLEAIGGADRPLPVPQFGARR